jgi:ribonuclease R
VSGLVGGGAFVRFSGELADIYEGFLPARLLQGDYYDLNETETALVGRRHGRAIRMGDPVMVSATGIETARGRVDLEPTGDRGSEPRRPKGNQGRPKGSQGRPKGGGQGSRRQPQGRRSPGTRGGGRGRGRR